MMPPRTFWVFDLSIHCLVYYSFSTYHITDIRHTQLLDPPSDVANVDFERVASEVDQKSVTEAAHENQDSLCLVVTVGRLTG